MRRVFLSYARPSREDAESHALSLEEAQFEVWTDWNGIPSGEPWEPYAHRAILKCDVYAAVVTEGFFDSLGYSFELSKARPLSIPRVALCADGVGSRDLRAEGFSHVLDLSAVGPSDRSAAVGAFIEEVISL